MKEYEAIRRAYFIEGKSIRAIARGRGHSRPLVRRAIASAEPTRYTLTEPRDAPVLGPYRKRIEQLLDENESMPRKQRYTAHRIFETIQTDGYSGSESSVRTYVAQRRESKRTKTAFLPLEFDPGQDAQVDWGEALAEIAGQRMTVQLFLMRLNYSRTKFVMAFPFQKQEAFFEGHIQAFRMFGGVPRNSTYDNLKTAVFRILEGRNRQEQRSFVTFRSYYLFASRYCTPGQGHEKGGVESDVGFARRNFMVPIPKVDSFAALNVHLHEACLRDTRRRMRGQTQTIAELWETEKPQLLPLPQEDYKACVGIAVKPIPYSQVVLRVSTPSGCRPDAGDTNRY